MKNSLAIMLATMAAGSLAAVPAWGKCGGEGHIGETSCVSGYSCVMSSEFYSQCLPGSGPAPTKDKTTATGGKTSAKTKKTKTPKTTAQATATLSTKTVKATTTKAGTTGGAGPANPNFPASAGSTALPTAKIISGTFDGGMMLWDRSPSVCQGQTETTEPDAMFILEDGAHIKNALIGANQAEGIHCRGTCTIENVWWVDVCEDAATFKQTSGTSYIIGGGARSASDKILQFNGRGTVSIDGFYAEDYGKLIRSCGDCAANGGPRNIIINNVVATKGSGSKGGPLCGINSNFGDTCKITNSCQKEGKFCDLYKGVTDHKGSSQKLSSGADGISCFISESTC